MARRPLVCHRIEVDRRAFCAHGFALRLDPPVGHRRAIESREQALADRMHIRLALDVAPASDDPVALDDHHGDGWRDAGRGLRRVQFGERPAERRGIGVLPMGGRFGAGRAGEAALKSSFISARVYRDTC